MADPRRLTDMELERMLRDLAPHYPYPATPNLAVAVRSRIVAAPTPKVVRLPLWRDPWRLALAAALLLIALSAALLINPVTRDAIAHFFHVRGVVVSRQPSPLPSISPTTSAGPYLGQRTTLEEAQKAVQFTIVVPPQLGAPDAVYLDTAIPGGEVALAYNPRPGIPLVKETGLGVLVTEFRGDLAPEAILKNAGPNTIVEETTVNGDPGWWLAGEPHAVVVQDGPYQARPETLRLAANTLIWEHAGVTYRIESNLSKAEAMRLASGMP
jgi:hypothetical protein